MEIKRYWSVVRRKWWIIALIVIASCSFALAYSFRAHAPTYQASTMLIVNANKASVGSPTTALDPGSISANMMLMKTYKAIIMTPRIMTKVVTEYPDLHLAAGELSAKVGVSAVRETQVMQISAEDASYERAAKIANAVSEVFRKEIPTLMNVDNVNILNWADPSAGRSAGTGSPLANVVIAFIVSSIIGTGVVFLLDYLDDKVRTEENIRDQLGLPTLAEIPRMKGGDAGSRGTEIPVGNIAGRETNATLDA